ncbi:hypothetical protein [Rhizocola hellebori]|nr:hypothetical protein [Rhizocola hellebori]
MRRILAVAALCAATMLPLAACSDAPKSESTALPGATSTAGSTPGAGGPSGAPGATGGPGGGGVTGTTTDKAACAAITAKLGTWGAAFAEAAGGLAAAGSDAGKVQVVVDKVKAANTKFAADLRAEGDKSKDAQVKKVAGELAAALEKVNTSLNAQQVASNPDALTAMFDTPEYVTASDNYEKLCGGA